MPRRTNTTQFQGNILGATVRAGMLAGMNLWYVLYHLYYYGQNKVGKNFNNIKKPFHLSIFCIHSKTEWSLLSCSLIFFHRLTFAHNIYPHNPIPTYTLHCICLWSIFLYRMQALWRHDLFLLFTTISPGPKQNSSAWRVLTIHWLVKTFPNILSPIRFE